MLAHLKRKPSERKSPGEAKMARLFGLNTTCDQKQCWDAKIFVRGNTPLNQETPAQRGKEKKGDKEEYTKKRSKGKGSDGIKREKKGKKRKKPT